MYVSPKMLNCYFFLLFFLRTFPLVESMNQPNPNAPTKFSHRNYQTKTYQLKPAKHNLHSELLIGFKLSGRQKNFSPGSVVQLAVLISNGPAPLVIQPALEGNELLWRLFNDKQPTKGFRLLHCDLQISPRSPRS